MLRGARFTNTCIKGWPGSVCRCIFFEDRRGGGVVAALLDFDQDREGGPPVKWSSGGPSRLHGWGLVNDVCSDTHGLVWSCETIGETIDTGRWRHAMRLFACTMCMPGLLNIKYTLDCDEK
jgi:hypothetical protein